MNIGVVLHLISALVGIAAAIWHRNHHEAGEDPLTGVVAGCGIFLFLPWILGTLAALWRFFVW